MCIPIYMFRFTNNFFASIFCYLLLLCWLTFVSNHIISTELSVLFPLSHLCVDFRCFGKLVYLSFFFFLNLWFFSSLILTENGCCQLLVILLLYIMQDKVFLSPTILFIIEVFPVHFENKIRGKKFPKSLQCFLLKQFYRFP